MRKVLLVGAALVLVMAACSSSGDDSGDDGDGGEAPVELQGTVNDEGGIGEVSNSEIEMELDDFYFGPTFAQTEGGNPVTVSLFNEGETQHTFTIDSLDVDEVLQPDATVEVEVTLPESGAVRYYCRFHADQGMQGAFYANAGDTVED